MHFFSHVTSNILCTKQLIMLFHVSYRILLSNTIKYYGSFNMKLTQTNTNLYLTLSDIHESWLIFGISEICNCATFELRLVSGFGNMGISVFSCFWQSGNSPFNKIAIFHLLEILSPQIRYHSTENSLLFTSKMILAAYITRP